VDACQQALAARLENMAAELASQLDPGAACPVCGSPEHPRPARPLTGAVSADEVAQAEQRRDAAAEVRAQAEADRAELAAELARLTAAAGGASLHDLAGQLAELDERVRLAEQGLAHCAELEPELAGLHAEQAQLDDDLKQAVAVSAAARAEAGRSAAEQAELLVLIKEAAQPYAAVAERQAALRAQAAADRELAGALTTLASAQATAERAAARAERELSASGFGDLAQARAAVLPVAEQAELDGQVTAWTAALAALTDRVQDPELAGLDPGQREQAQVQAEAAARALAVARLAERDIGQDAATLTERESRLTRRLAELAQAEAAADELAERTEPVLRLAGLARGLDGHRRMTLTTYVLRRWFEQVVAAANVRLAAMSAGRYELVRIEEGDRKNERIGLTLAVIDRHTGEQRSPRSLSGGETFYTSLALALGLADVAAAEAGGVELDTLFIDEGFGSLDADTLDQVMSVLDELRDCGRAVGIVSHVADLKDRVGERLEIRRRPDGSSQATVVA
jgi:DNA repair protein SbcC/Rad50